MPVSPPAGTMEWAVMSCFQPSPKSYSHSSFASASGSTSATVRELSSPATSSKYSSGGFQ